MIQANELRIGNMVVYMGREIIVHVGTMNDCEKERYKDQYNPIPLTPELLEKAGFEEKNSGEFWRRFVLKNGWHISQWICKRQIAGFEETGAFYWGDDYIKVKYLHQLQNLYHALTGEELNINL